MADGVISYVYPMFVDHIKPKGFLTYDKRLHACFYYYVMCQKLLEKAGSSIDDQIRYDTDSWWDKPYGNIAKSTAILYGLEDAGEFLKDEIKKVVQLEVARLGFPRPAAEYWVNISPDTLVTV